MFTASVGHAAANFCQYDEYAYPPNYPARLHGKRPRNKVSVIKWVGERERQKKLEGSSLWVYFSRYHATIMTLDQLRILAKESNKIEIIYAKSEFSQYNTIT